MSQEARDKVGRILRDAAIKFEVRHIGATTQPQGDGKAWECDQWKCTFTIPPGDPYDFDYFTGLGLRSEPTEREQSIARGRWGAKPVRGTVFAEEQRKYLEAARKPKPPHAADVLYSLLSDGEAVNQSFRDWCGDLGMDDDSIKALNTYNECCKTGETLRKFPRAALEALREALEGY